MIFESKKYKKRALTQLKGRWTTAVIATLITLFITGLLSSSQEFSSKQTETTGNAITADYIYPHQWDTDYEWSASESSDNFVFTLFTIAVSGILFLAMSYLFNEYYKTTEQIHLSTFIEGLSLWFKGIKASLWYSLWVFLWSLLFFIPGIVKAIAYSMTYFVIAENPSISVTKALTISKLITKGYKANIFFMGLSFIGWNILSIFTFGILQLWLIPYESLTLLNAYKELKAQAIHTGVLSLEDFN